MDTTGLIRATQQHMREELEQAIRYGEIPVTRGMVIFDMTDYPDTTRNKFIEWRTGVKKETFKSIVIALYKQILNKDMPIDMYSGLNDVINRAHNTKLLALFIYNNGTVMNLIQ